MPEPDAAWLGRVVPPAPDWTVNPRWYGLFTHQSYDDPFACFAANRTCRQDLVRQLTGPVLPFAIPYTPPGRPDLHPDGDARHGGDEDADPDADADAVRGEPAGGAGDGDGRSATPDVRADDGSTGDAGGLLLDARPAVTDRAADATTVRDARTGNAVLEGGLM